jgi:hypothetical protein
MLRKTGRVVAAVLLGLISAGAAPPPITDWSNIETVIVTAAPPGPALWHVVRGKSEVWILGTVQPMPKGLKWDAREIRSLIKDSHALLLPPRAQVSLIEGAWFLLTGMGTLQQPDGMTLEASLSPALTRRFVAARTRIGTDAGRYENYLPAIAALLLEGDYWRANNLSMTAPQKTLELFAAEASVPAHAVGLYPAMDVIHDVPKLSPAAHRACLDYALSDIEIQSANAAAAAAAWAVGDVAGIEAHYSESKLDACLQQSNVYAALRQRAIRDTAAAIVAALNRPGRSFAVIPFLRKGGVLEQLTAAGLTVTGPGS